MRILSNLYSYVSLAVSSERADMLITSFFERFNMHNSFKIVTYGNLKNNISNGVITTTTKNVTGTNTDNKTSGFTGFTSANQSGTYEKEQNQNQNTVNETVTINNLQDDIDFMENVKFSLMNKFENEFKDFLFQWVLQLGEYY